MDRNSKLLADIQISLDKIKTHTEHVEDLINQLRERGSVSEYKDDVPAESQVGSSRIHREVPPIIPADMMSTVSRGSVVGGTERVQPSRVPANYTDWADNLSRMSTVSRTAGAAGAASGRH
jgi:hypothetical protein